MPSEVIELEGHIIDSLILPKVMDMILAAGADYRMVEFEIGRTNADTSRARIEVTADEADALVALLTELQVHGANPLMPYSRRTTVRPSSTSRSRMRRIIAPSVSSTPAVSVYTWSSTHTVSV